jgi:hypothetical protein
MENKGGSECLTFLSAQVSLDIFQDFDGHLRSSPQTCNKKKKKKKKKNQGKIKIIDNWRN